MRRIRMLFVVGTAVVVCLGLWLGLTGIAGAQTGYAVRLVSETLTRTGKIAVVLRFTPKPVALAAVG